MATDILKLVIEVVDKASLRLKKIGQGMDNLDKKSKKAKNSFFASSFGLAFLGRRLVDFSQTAIKEITSAYTNAVDESNIFLQKTLGVQAAFEFLKFSMFDALTQSELFIPLIDFIISATNAIAEFINKHPEVAAFIGIFLGITLVLGFVAIAIGTANIAMTALGIESVAALLPLIATVGILLWATWKLFDIWKSNDKTINKTLKTSLLAGFLVGLGMIISSVYLIIAGIAMMGAALFEIGKESGGPIGLLKNTFRGLFGFIIVGAESMVNVFIDGINKIIEGLNSIPGLNLNISPLKHVKWVNAFEKAWKPATPENQTWLDSKLFPGLGNKPEWGGGKMGYGVGGTWGETSQNIIPTAQGDFSEIFTGEIDGLGNIFSSKIDQMLAQLKESQGITTNVTIEGSMMSEGEFFEKLDQFQSDFYAKKYGVST